MYTNYLKCIKERDTGVRLSVAFAAVVANGTKDLRRVFDRVCPLMSTPPFALISLSSQVWTNGRQWKGMSYALTRFIRRYCAASCQQQSIAKSVVCLPPKWLHVYCSVLAVIKQDTQTVFKRVDAISAPTIGLK